VSRQHGVERLEWAGRIAASPTHGSSPISASIALDALARVREVDASDCSIEGLFSIGDGSDDRVRKASPHTNSPQHVSNPVNNTDRSYTNTEPSRIHDATSRLPRGTVDRGDIIRSVDFDRIRPFAGTIAVRIVARFLRAISRNAILDRDAEGEGGADRPTRSHTGSCDSPSPAEWRQPKCPAYVARTAASRI
jgi:hypothetical protein